MEKKGLESSFFQVGEDYDIAFLVFLHHATFRKLHLQVNIQMGTYLLGISVRLALLSKSLQNYCTARFFFSTVSCVLDSF